MDAADLFSAWREIAESASREGPYLYLQLLGGAVPIGAIVRSADHSPGLLVRFPASDYHHLPKAESGRGFSFEKPVQVGTDTWGLPIILADLDAEELFAQMGADLINEVNRSESELPPVQRVLRRIALWRRFMQRRRGLLTSDEVRGLFAELEVLRHCIRNDGPEEALDAWRGPAGSLQDFSFADSLLEVKSWHIETGARVRISDPGQILVEQLRPVFLVTVQLSVGAVGMTLGEAVAIVRQELGSSGADRFGELLSAYGYLEIHAQEYTDRISVLSVEAFRVKDCFPHIDIRALPGGISGVQYSIELGALDEFREANRHLNIR